MANFFFYEDRRKVGPVSASQVKRLAATGCIKPDTIVESEDGKQSSASKLKGLDFSVPSSIEPDTPSAEPDTYGLCVPNIYDKPPETPKQDTAPNTAAAPLQFGFAPAPPQNFWYQTYRPVFSVIVRIAATLFLNKRLPVCPAAHLQLGIEGFAVPAALRSMQNRSFASNAGRQLVPPVRLVPAAVAVPRLLISCRQMPVSG